MVVQLTESNFLAYASKHYDSLFPDSDEFLEDLKRIVYLKRLFNSYAEKGDLKERLILNHLVILYNMFGEHATRMLFLKLEGHEIVLKTFLSFLNRMPGKVEMIGNTNKTLNNLEIPLDPEVWRRLVTL